MELNVNRLTKQYKNKIAVDRISYIFREGIYGLLGANGAGKTTLMRMLCGILEPTGGEVSFNGISVAAEEYRAALRLRGLDGAIQRKRQRSCFPLFLWRIWQRRR